jgi:hypothetical protein
MGRDMALMQWLERTLEVPVEREGVNVSQASYSFTSLR